MKKIFLSVMMLSALISCKQEPKQEPKQETKPEPKQETEMTVKSEQTNTV